MIQMNFLNANEKDLTLLYKNKYSKKQQVDNHYFDKTE